MCQVVKGFLGKRVKYQVWKIPEREKKGEFVTKEGMVVAIGFSSKSADFYFLIKKDDGKLFTSIGHSEIIEVLKT